MSMEQDERQLQTNACFSYKWARRDTYESEAVRTKNYRWLVERYFGAEKEREIFMEQSIGRKILDAGCGSGFSASLFFSRHLNYMQYFGVDSLDSIIIARERFKELGIQGRFIEGSITTMDLKEKFDIIFCEGVLHHTSDPFKSLRNLVRHLNDGGIIMFYVYKKKAPVREFADEMIRGKLKPLSDKDAWEKIKPITKLGKAIGDLNIEINIEEEIELLEIPKGNYDLQRLFYWFFLKMYYDKTYSLEEMNHVNFDWYRPSNCYRFRPEEIKAWLHELNLRTMRFIVEDSGITVVAMK